MTQGGFGDTISSQLKHHLLSVLSNVTRDDLITPKSWVKVAEVPRYIWKHPTRKQQALACSFGGRGQDYVTNQSTETPVVCPVKCHQGWQSLFSQPGTLSCKINQTCMWGSCLAWNNKNKHLHPSCAGRALDLQSRERLALFSFQHVITGDYMEIRGICSDVNNSIIWSKITYHWIPRFN